jgi:hypothetical protein
MFRVIDSLDAPSLLYFLQKHITRRSRVTRIGVPSSWIAHKKYISEYGTTGTVFEFGAGKHLGQNLFLSDLVDKQIVVDLNLMIEIEMVEQVRSQLVESGHLKNRSNIYNIDDLKEFGILYKAPFHASKTKFENETLDACVSTNTLEHIPECSIIKIFSELYRTLKYTGIISARIDYTDHYAHTDKTISLLNYLKYDDASWAKYNHNCHYQNRLRHYDYVRIFKSAGFEVVKEELIFNAKNIPRELVDKYKTKPKTWKATSAHLVLKKK